MRLGLNRLLPEQLRDMEAMLPHLPQRPLRQVLPEVTPATGETRYRVGFFLGCAQSLLFAEESAATVRVLSRNGCTVITPRMSNAAACRRTAMAAWTWCRAGQAQYRFIRKDPRWKSSSPIAPPAAPRSRNTAHILNDDPEWAERAQAFSAKVRDISEFLVEIPLEKPTGTRRGPRHLPRPLSPAPGQKVWKQPRALLKLIDGLEFVELPEADWCCGSAGSQLITHYETSLQVLDRKMDNLASTQAEVIASGCPGCQMQLNTGIKRRGLNVRVVHPITLLDEAYEG